MRIEADRMSNLVLTDAEIDPERKVVLEERRSRIENNPGGKLREQANAALYMNHPYRIPIIGWHHEIVGLTRDDMMAFYLRVVCAEQCHPGAVGRYHGRKAFGRWWRSTTARCRPVRCRRVLKLT